MLTADLVAARRHGGELRVVPLDPRMRARAAELAARYLELARHHVGRTRDEYDEACAAVEVEPRERRVADGVRKLIEDRCDFDADESVEPETLRRAVFLRATEVRRALPDGARFDRVAVVGEAAVAAGLRVDALERALYADLRGAHVLKGVRPASPAQLAADYDLAQAQAVLLRAVRVVAEVSCARPDAYRTLFRKLKFLRLLYRITRNEPRDDDADEPAGGWRIEIDGPFSLFESVTRYGLQLALALPAIAACGRWRVEAEVRWGREREPLWFRVAGGRTESAEVGAEAGTEAGAESAIGPSAVVPDGVGELLADLRALPGRWRIEPSTEILDLPGVGLCVPDLVFEQPRKRRRVYLEVMGYWSREAVWRRVELVEGGLPHRILFAVGKHLRVSEQALDGDASGALYVYNRRMNARAVMDRIEALATRPPRKR